MVPSVWSCRRPLGSRTILGALVAGALLVVPALSAQERFIFYVLATDAAGAYVTDLTPADVSYIENGQPGQIVSVEPFRRPVKLTLVVDNGGGSDRIIGNFRTGLEGFFKELPEDIEVTVISTSPQPRTVLRPTANREQILQAVNRIGLDSDPPRFSDALYEYTERIGKEPDDSVPVILMLSSTADEASSVQPAQLQTGLKTLASRGVRVYVLQSVSQPNNARDIERLDTGRQKVISEMYANATGGVYAGVRVVAELHDMLPGLGALLGQMHRQHASQVKVTVNRPAGLSGALQNPDIRLTRQGLSGSVSADGRIRQ